MAAFAYWLGRELLYRRKRKAFLRNTDARGRPIVALPQRAPKQPKQQLLVSDRELKERAKVLRAAVDRGDLPLEEAAESLVRFAGGLDIERARSMLRR